MVNNIHSKIKAAVESPTKAKHYVIKNIEDWYISRQNTTVLDYTQELQYQRGNVLISYLPAPFYYFPFSPRFHSSSNRWQSIQIAKIFNRMGFVVDVCHLDRDPPSLDYEKYDILFGQGQNFKKFSEYMDESVLKIYYATSEHPEKLKSNEAKRIRDLNKRRDGDIDPTRSFSNNQNFTEADAIVSIGESTGKSYSKRFEKKVEIEPITISTSPKASASADLAEKDFETAKTNFVWFGGSGPVLKGLDLTLEAFSEFEDIDLYVCGPALNNDEFSRIYNDELFNTDNIHPVGWVNLESDDFNDLIDTVGYAVYPTASDGIPSSVATITRAGVIPIAPPSIVDFVTSCGIQLEQCTVRNLSQIIETAASLPAEDVEQGAIEAFNFANTNFTRDSYTQDMTRALWKIMMNFDKLDIPILQY